MRYCYRVYLLDCVANLRKTRIYNAKVDLVKDNVYTKFGLIQSIHSQDIEQKSNYDGRTERMKERQTGLIQYSPALNFKGDYNN